MQKIIPEKKRSIKPMALKELPKWDRPREKLMVLGANALTEAELLAIIIRVGRRGENVVNLCQRLIKDGICSLLDKSVRELRRYRGIGMVKAIQIAAVFELAKRVDEIRLNEKTRIKSPNQIADLYLKKFANEKREKFVAVFLDTKNGIISEKLISIGTLNTSLIHPRELFKEAVRESAASIILIHNHPSGDPTPSKDDINVTKQLLKAAKVMDIRIIDHLVIGSKMFDSVLSYV